jgi:hypothetical protein
MIHVIQIFRSFESIPKADYPEKNKKLLEQWKGSFLSKTGYLKDGTLFLPLNKKEELEEQKTGLVILQDIHNYDALLAEKSCDTSVFPPYYSPMFKDRLFYLNPQFYSFNCPAKNAAFEIFRMVKKEEGGFDLFLDYSRHTSIGIPKRADHKIAELKLNTPIRYRINGKSDYKQRTFNEYDYLIVYLGQAEKVEFRPLNEIGTMKELPLANCKQVDERKVLK